MSVTKLRQMVLALALFAILSLTLAACDSSNSTPTSGPTNSDAELVKRAGVNMKALKSYHIEASGTIAAGDTKISGDIDAGNSNSRLDMNVAGQDLQTIQIGPDTYTSSDGGKTFTKSEGAGMNIGSFVRIWDSFNPSSIDKNAANFKDDSPAQETIDGTTTKHITASSSDLNLGSAGAAGGTNSTLDLWITTDATPIVRQMKLVGQSGSQGVNLTFKWSHINENFDIKAPSTQPAPKM
jgi:hypothetical protein